MCGIVGYWRLDQKKLDLCELNIFTDSLAHRGPDGRGTYMDDKESLFLGHRRLAILDLTESAQQPFFSEDRRYVFVFNGEIYNFLELREELEAKGLVFQTQSDTEVVLKAYETWGEDCQFKFNGMWAFAIWDKINRRLFLSRDRFGVKPLYYYFDQNVFAFASELKAFLALTSLHICFDENIFSRSLCAPNHIEGCQDTILKDVYNLKGGYCGVISRSFPKIRQRQWWKTLDHLNTECAYGNEIFLKCLADACKIRMRSDVPLASALSGGMDSSSVVGMMSQLHKSNQIGERSAQDWRSAFVASFPGAPEDETELAQEVARHTQTDIYPVELNAQDAVNNLEKIIFDFESVFTLPANGWLLYKAMRKEGKVVSIDGHGGDELLAGYHHYPLVGMIDSIGRNLADIPMLRDQYVNAMGGHESCHKGNIRSKIQNFLPKGEYRFSHQWLNTHLDLVHFSIDDRLKRKTYLYQSLYFDFHHTLLPTILRNFDRVSMAHGVEIRAPFMDWKLVQLGFSLPDDKKIHAGYGKYILRDSVQGLIPDSVRWLKRKLGFVSPFTTWLKEGLGERIQGIVHEPSFLNESLWKGSLIRDHAVDAFKKEQWNALHASWPFVQGYLLKNSFRSKRKEYLSI